MNLQLLIKLKIETDITDFRNEKWWQSVRNYFLSTQYPFLLSDRIHGWKPMLASLAYQQDGSSVWEGHLRNPLSLYFLKLCLQSGHLICSSGSFMGTLKMGIKDGEAKTQ